MRRSCVIARTPRLLAILLAAGICNFFPLSASAADGDAEQRQLAALLRQLDVLERLAQHSAASTIDGNRYHFDYARLHADITRVRAGIEDYLSPQRAQPRDPTILNGGYRQEAQATP
jgi:RAQPRD family integrative conjugative element protein